MADHRAELVAATAQYRTTIHAKERWEQAIRAALTAGMTATEVAKLARVTRQRVQQIRDGRR
jgi:hypothetical protein